MSVTNLGGNVRVEYKWQAFSFNPPTVGNLVTVVTNASHSYVSGDAIYISGLNGNARRFGNAGERYEGTFTITVSTS